MKLLKKAKKRAKKEAERAMEDMAGESDSGSEDGELSRGDFDTKAADTIPGNVKMYAAIINDVIFDNIIHLNFFLLE